MKVLRGQRNQCSVCGEYFNSNHSFEIHRTGKFGVDRRCLTPEEMRAKGMSLNAAEFWISAASDNRWSNNDGEEGNDSTGEPEVSDS